MTQFRRTKTKKTKTWIDAANGRRQGHKTGWAARIAALSICLFLLAAVTLAAPSPSSAQVAIGVSVTIAPPAIPVYVQPLCPGPGYIWVPGYWAWDPAFGYYWVPGTWVFAPFPGALWTPGYWAWSDGVFVWYDGYWGPTVGFYGGINYGFGYTGYGYRGGYWRGGTFYYNRSVNNINITNIRTVYYTRVTRVVVRRAGYNGGPGGIRLRPTAAQLAAARAMRMRPIAVQRRQERTARSDPRLRAAVNHGRPAIAATTRPGVFTHGVVRASRAGAPYRGVAPRRMPRRQIQRRTMPSRTMQRRQMPSRTMQRRQMVRPRMERRPGAFAPPGVLRLAPERGQGPAPRRGAGPNRDERGEGRPR